LQSGSVIMQAFYDQCVKKLTHRNADSRTATALSVIMQAFYDQCVKKLTHRNADSRTATALSCACNSHRSPHTSEPPPLSLSACNCSLLTESRTHASTKQPVCQETQSPAGTPHSARPRKLVSHCACTATCELRDFIQASKPCSQAPWSCKHFTTSVWRSSLTAMPTLEPPPLPPAPATATAHHTPVNRHRSLLRLQLPPLTTHKWTATTLSGACNCHRSPHTSEPPPLSNCACNCHAHHTPVNRHRSRTAPATALSSPSHELSLEYWHRPHQAGWLSSPSSRSHPPHSPIAPHTGTPTSTLTLTTLILAPEVAAHQTPRTGTQKNSGTQKNWERDQSGA
jgi:hypothetical protein